jgi:hypothetical protein
MIIDMDQDGDKKLDTDTASREELAEACIAIHKWWTHLGKMLDRQEAALTAQGLSLDEAADFPLTITDAERVGDWFAKARAAYDADQDA